jgi:hypothetical protein
MIGFKMKFFTKLLRFTCVIPLMLLLMVGCGGSSSGDRPESLTSPNVNGKPSLDKIYTYQTTLHSKQVLSCAKLYLTSNSCDVADIRPIGSNITGDISLEDIKKRLVISHDWMADGFIAALQEINDQDLLNLFKPINTVVISYDIIPSFYNLKTASMYLDARYLWRNNEEWETIYELDDYRSDYKTEFIFDSFLRYIDASSNTHITWSNSYKTNSYNSRTSTQISPGLFRVLSHELAHANDFLSPDILAALGDGGKIYDDYIKPGIDINDELSSAIPLTSNLLIEAAQIAFRGADITNRIKNTSASEAGNSFDGDGAADFYAYSTGAEDVAMLFEAFMMYKKYGAVSDVAFVTIPTSNNINCDDYIIKWGQRNRLADRNVKQRAILVSSKILARDITPELSSLASSPIDMTTDIGWCASLTAVSSKRANILYSGTKQQVVHDYQDDRVR